MEILRLRSRRNECGLAWHPNSGGLESACTLSFLPVTLSLFTEDMFWDPSSPVSSTQFHSGARKMTQSIKCWPCNWEQLSSYLQIHTKPAQTPHPNTPPGRWKAEAREFPEAHGLAMNDTETRSQSNMGCPVSSTCTPGIVGACAHLHANMSSRIKCHNI